MHPFPAPLLFPLLAILLVPAAPAAQPAGGRPAAARIGLTVDTALTGQTGFTAGDAAAGGASVTQFSARLSVPLPPVGGQWYPSLSLRYRQRTLDRDAGTPLPERLQALSAGLGFFGRLNPDWSVFAIVSPGVANSGGGFGSQGLSAGVIALASRRFGTDSSAGFGFVFDSLARGSGRLFPVATIDWSPSPGWKAFLGYPRSGVSWQASATLKAEFVAEADFGSYYVKEDPLPRRPGRTPLDRTRLEYRAARVGPAVTWQPDPALSMRLGAGFVPMLRC